MSQQYQGPPQSAPLPYPQQQPMYQPQSPIAPPPTPKKKSRKGLWITLAVVVLVIIIAIASHSGGSSPSTSTTSSNTNTSTITQPTAKPTTAPAVKWTTVQTFTGNGAKKTSLFAVSNDWKIVWTCNGQNIGGVTADGVLTVSVYGSDNSIVDPGAVNATCKAGSKPTSDVTEEHQGGNIYLDVNATGDWTIQIQEMK